MLGGDELRKEAKKRATDEGQEDMEEVFRSMAKRGKQTNLSFFAFTAHAQAQDTRRVRP